MQTAEITIAYKNQPKTLRGPGNVKDTNGKYWKVWKEEFPKFETGCTYSITYDTEMYQGEEQHTVRTVLPISSPSKTANSPAPAPKYGATDMTTTERIFVCGAYNSILGNPGLNPSVLTENQHAHLVNTLRKVWARTFGGNPSVGDEMNDQVPF